MTAAAQTVVVSWRAHVWAIACEAQFMIRLLQSYHSTGKSISRDTSPPTCCVPCTSGFKSLSWRTLQPQAQYCHFELQNIRPSLQCANSQVNMPHPLQRCQDLGLFRPYVSFRWRSGYQLEQGHHHKAEEERRIHVEAGALRARRRKRRVVVARKLLCPDADGPHVDEQPCAGRTHPIWGSPLDCSSELSL